MAKLAKRGWSHSAMEESQYRIKKPCAKVQEEKIWGIESPAHSKLKAVTDRRPVLVPDNQVDGTHYCQNGTAQNLQARWRCKEMGVPPPQCLQQLTPLLRQLLLGTPPAPTSVTEGVCAFQIKCVPPRYLCIHTSLPNAVFFNVHVYAKNHKWEKDVIPDMVTDKATSTGWSTLCCLVMQLTCILQTTAAYWLNLQVKMSIDSRERDVWMYYNWTFLENWNYILKDIFCCIIEGQCKHEGECGWRL